MFIYLGHLELDAHGNCTTVQTNKDDTQLYYGYLIKLGSVCGGLIVLVSVVLLVCYVYNKRKNKQIRVSDVSNTVMENPYYDLAPYLNQAQSEQDEIWSMTS